MTNPISKNQAYNIPSGTLIIGKWHQQKYKVIKQLGFGAQGTVYLAQSDEQLVALKIGRDSSSIITEVNVLKHIGKVQGEILGPCLYDVDDWVTNIGLLPFYTMEYIDGVSLFDSTKEKGFDWGIVFIIQLLGDLGKLHKEGWVFGDLKPDNLMITNNTRRIRWLDVGGTTRLGRSIKEYTEFFDRGYWGFGSRKAEPSYDLFAVVMVMINMAYRKRFEKPKNPREYLVSAIKNNSHLKPFENILVKALKGDYDTASAMRQDMLLKLNETTDQVVRNNSKSIIPPDGKSKGHSKKKMPSSQGNRMNRRKNKKKEWRQTIFLALGIMIAYVIYITVYVM